MASFPVRARRLFFAGAFAVALSLAPGLAVFAGATTSNAAAGTVAGSTGSNCRGGGSAATYSLACAPDVGLSGSGAPSEMGLTVAPTGMGMMGGTAGGASGVGGAGGAAGTAGGAGA